MVQNGVLSPKRLYLNSPIGLLSSNIIYPLLLLTLFSNSGFEEKYMTLGTMYIIADNIENSVEFYRLLFQEEPLYSNDDRWVQFSNKIALYNRAYDEKIIGRKPSERFNQAYIDDFYKSSSSHKNNTVVFNFVVDCPAADCGRR